MKRIIRLTETDLTRIVRRIIKEQDELKTTTKKVVNKEKKSYEELRSDFLKSLTPDEKKAFLELEKLSSQKIMFKDPKKMN